jgi:TraM recognition site of TraD and TraG
MRLSSGIDAAAGQKPVLTLADEFYKVAPLLTRLDTFLRPKLIRAMVSQRTNRLDFKRIMNERGILLARLSQGAIGEENAYLLGTLLVSKLHQLTLGRQEMDASERSPFYLYIDEFQNFVTPSMSAILSGARKYNLGLILAHQEFRQLWGRDQDVASAVISNPYTRICFRLGDFDAQKLADGFAAFSASDLQNLGVGQAIARVERNEYDFNLTTFPPPELDEEAAARRRAEIIRLSRDQYAERVTPTDRFRPTSVVDPIVAPREQETHQQPPKPDVPRVQENALEQQAAPKLLRLPVAPLGRGGQQHKYLQQLIKRFAEDRDFKVTVEQPVLGGAGSVDLALERDNLRIACEISVSSPTDYELKNIQKCLAAGFAHVVVVSSDQKTLNKIRRRATEELQAETLESVSFLLPEEVLSFLEARAPVIANEKTVKGYRVKVKYQPVSQAEQRSRKEAIGQTILQAMKRLKNS